MRLRVLLDGSFYFQKISDNGDVYEDCLSLFSALKETRLTDYDYSTYRQTIVAEDCLLRWPVEALGEPIEYL